MAVYTASSGSSFVTSPMWNNVALPYSTGRVLFSEEGHKYKRILTTSRASDLPNPSSSRLLQSQSCLFSTSTISSPKDAEMTMHHLRSDVKLLGKMLGNSIKEHTGENKSKRNNFRKSFIFKVDYLNALSRAKCSKAIP